MGRVAISISKGRTEGRSSTHPVLQRFSRYLMLPAQQNTANDVHQQSGVSYRTHKKSEHTDTSTT